jgi:hypothetical protein
MGDPLEPPAADYAISLSHQREQANQQIVLFNLKVINTANG